MPDNSCLSAQKTTHTVHTAHILHISQYTVHSTHYNFLKGSPQEKPGKFWTIDPSLWNPPTYFQISYKLLTFILLYLLLLEPRKPGWTLGHLERKWVQLYSLCRDCKYESPFHCWPCSHWVVQIKLGGIQLNVYSDKLIWATVSNVEYLVSENGYLTQDLLCIF